MTRIQGNVPSDTTAPKGRSAFPRFIGAILVLVGIAFMGLGVLVGPIRYATSTPGKLTVEYCMVDDTDRSSFHSSRHSSHSTHIKTKIRRCYGTFTANNGSARDLNAEMNSDALYQKGRVLDARRISDTNHEQDHGWVYAIAMGCAWVFGALIPLAVGVFVAVTDFPYRKGENQGSFRTCLTLAGVGVLGLVVSCLVAFFA